MTNLDIQNENSLSTQGMLKSGHVELQIVSVEMVKLLRNMMKKKGL